MLDFILRVGSLATELNRLLGTKFLPENINKTPLGRSFSALMILHNSQQYELRDFETVKLSMLVEDLKRLEQERPDILKYFKRKIKESRSADNFYGIRFEIHIASTLLKKQILFEKEDPPDFLINNSELAIECSSVRIINSKNTEFVYKVGSCIRKKGKEEYSNLNTALFIDITNIIYKSDIVDMSAIRKEAKAALCETSFGNVILFAYIMNKEQQRFECNYARVDKETISEELKDFLNSYFPLGSYRVSNYTVPIEG
jgi:hypothetical protein